MNGKPNTTPGRAPMLRRSAQAAPLLVVAALALLAGCGGPSGYPPHEERSNYAHRHCDNCGVIERITAEQSQGDDSIGLGTVLGGVAGAAIGSQIGHGRGNTAAIVGGAAGGAYAGHEIEKSQRSRIIYRFTVRMDSGSYADITQDGNPGLRVGDSVRIVDGRVVAL